MPRTVVVDLTPLDTPSRVRGIGRYIRTLASGIAQLPAANRAGLRILGLTRVGWLGSYEVTDRLDAFLGNRPTHALTKRDHYRWAYQRRVGLWRALRDIHADLVHLGDPNATPIAMGLSGCVRLVTCHDLIPLRFPERYLRAVDGFGLLGPRILRHRYQSADHVLAISDATANDLIHLLGLAPSKITRVHNGVDLALWGDRRTETPRLGVEFRDFVDKPFLLYVGDTDWRKNVEGMAAGLGHARAAGANVRLLIAGEMNDAKRRRVFSLASQHGVSDAVRLVGHVTDAHLGALYRSAVAHLFVSRYEGFGLPVVEAMACGCPVITTRAGALAEVAGEAALLVNPEDPASIGEAILQILGDTDLRRRLSEAGIQRSAQFSVLAQAKQTVSLYARLVGA